MTTKLRAASFQDGAVTSAKIAADAVTAAKIPANAIGSSELDLTADYAFTGTVAGTDLVKLLDVSFGSSAGAGSITHYDVDSTYINSTYDAYDIIGYFRPDGDNRYLYMKLMTGGSVITDGYLGYEGVYATGSGAFGGNTESSFGFQYAGSGTAVGRGTRLHARVSNVNNTTAPCSITGMCNYAEHTGGAHQGGYMCGSLIATQYATVINGFRFQFHSGSIHGGYVKIYGIK